MRSIFKSCAVVFFLVFFFLYAHAQHRRPKIGLVLSGGAARGMAHIGIIKAMEKAGLRPDYITGTSMGSIIGGLYAIGYSADEINSIASNIDWNEILTNKISFDKIALEEKPFYGRYLVETPIGWPLKVKLPMGLLEGQNLGEMLFDLTRRVHNVHNFNDFPIPFACVATDISTGQPVVLKKGNLARSLRASMAIPTVFTPVTINDTLLVDGGLVRNFPVQEVIDMGADIVIGVFVSSDLIEKERLHSFVSVLFQSSWVLSAYDTREQKKKIDYYIEPDLVGFSSTAFKESKQIIKRGMEAGELYYPVFKRLADSLNAISLQSSIQLPEIINTYILTKVSVEGNEKIPADLIIGKLRINEGASLTAGEIEKKITLLFGTGYFDNVGYQLKKENNTYELIVSVKETSPGKIKAAIHYDTENKAGINLNYTLRNAVLPNSRIILEADLAEFPRVNLNYLKYFGKHQRAAAMLDLHYSSFNPIVNAVNTGKKEVYAIDQYSATASVFTTGAVDRSFGVYLSPIYLTMKPQSSPDPLVNAFKYINYTSYKTTAFFRLDNVDDRYYAKKGMRSLVSANYYFGSSVKFKYETDTVRLNERVSASNMLLLHGDINKVFPVSPFLSVSAGTGLSVAVLNSTPDASTSILGSTYFGGVRPRIFGSLPFYGAENYEYSAVSYFVGKLDLQFQLANHLFITTGFNYINTRLPMDWFIKDFNQDGDLLDGKTWRLGYGAALGYVTFIGPVSLSLGMDSRSKKVLANFGLGFYF